MMSHIHMLAFFSIDAIIMIWFDLPNPNVSTQKDD